MNLYHASLYSYENNKVLEEKKTSYYSWAISEIEKGKTSTTFGRGQRTERLCHSEFSVREPLWLATNLS